MRQQLFILLIKLHMYNKNCTKMFKQYGSLLANDIILKLKSRTNGSQVNCFLVNSLETIVISCL